MADITERLRATAGFCADWNSCFAEDVALTATEAADEIDALRALLKEAREFIDNSVVDPGPDNKITTNAMLARIDAKVKP